MDDFLGILVVVIFYLIVAANGGKKKKAKQSRARAKRTREAAFERAFEEVTQALNDAMEGLPVTQAKPAAQTVPAHQASCEGSRIHLHETTQQQMEAAFEGEDPCHAGGAPEAESSFYDEGGSDAPNALAQDVLRGVIMSEILTRPCERAAMRRNGRSI